MLKKVFYCIALIFLVLTFTVQANAAIVSINSSETSIDINPNESFSIDIYAQEDVSLGDLTSYGFYVDPNDSLSLVTFDGYTISNSDYDDLGLDNYIDGFKNSLTPNAGENILIATLFFTAGDIEGTDTLQLKGFVSELEGLSYEFIDSDINVSFDINVVPIPGALWLLGSGLISLVGLRRNFKK